MYPCITSLHYILVDLAEQAGAADLLVGHCCSEDAHRIAQERVVCPLGRSLAREEVERELLNKLLLLGWLDGEVLKVPLPRFALQRRGELPPGGLRRAPCYV